MQFGFMLLIVANPRQEALVGFVNYWYIFTMSDPWVIAEVLRECGPESVRAAIQNRQIGYTPWYQVDDALSLSSFACAATLFLGSGQKITIEQGALLLLPAGCRRRFQIHSPGLHRTVHLRHGQLPLEGPIQLQVDTYLATVVNRAIDTILGSFSDQAQIAHAWSLCWYLHEGHRGEQLPADPVRKAQHYILQHLGEDLRMPAVASASGLSHNQLLRRFRAATGVTVVAWLARQRVARAVDLLLHTDLPVAVIGKEVGYPDPQHFNKVMRRHTGQSPRSLRQSKE